MKQKKLYYRKQGDAFIIEGIRTKYGKRERIKIKTLPDPSTLIAEIDENGSFFKQKNKQEMMSILEGLDFKGEKKKKIISKVQLRKINRSFQKDPLEENQAQDIQEISSNAVEEKS